MKNILRALVVAMILMLALPAMAQAWYCAYCGFEDNGNFCSNCGERHVDWVDSSPWDMGIPWLEGRVYTRESMNMVVLWVQTQLKATGVYYQGDAWDVTGNLGDHTAEEIRAFMQARGYRYHSGNIDQHVVDELAAYLNYNTVPVYVGGYYEKMNTIMNGGSDGSMEPIVSNLRDMIPHVTTGARWVQVCLSELGYYSGAIDGKYGEATERAVKAFQADHGFQERDYVTLGVARAMLESCQVRGCTLTRLP